jgi:hypothetical protein
LTLWALPFSNSWAYKVGSTLGLLLIYLLSYTGTLAQKGKPLPVATDTSAPANLAKPIIRDSTYIADSLRIKQIKKATRRSAIVPGWGQATNKQVWKVPIVYAGLGIPAYLFFQNLSQYKLLRETFRVLAEKDSAGIAQIPDNLKPLSINSIRFYRDQYRRNVDYSVLAFIIAWGLNVVDAAVYANLRDFDVSDKLTLRISPQYDPRWQTAGVGFVLRPSNKSKALRSFIP